MIRPCSCSAFLGRCSSTRSSSSRSATHIKMAVDADQQPGRFWLTGSQQFHLMRDVSESLAGRVASCSCWDCRAASRTERAWISNRSCRLRGVGATLADGRRCRYPTLRADLARVLPALALTPAWIATCTISSYVQTYLQRDVRDLVGGRRSSIPAFHTRLRCSDSSVLNVAELARDAEVAPTPPSNGSRSSRPRGSSTSSNLTTRT